MEIRIAKLKGYKGLSEDSFAVYLKTKSIETTLFLSKKEATKINDLLTAELK